MQTQALFHESLADALRECVAVCGGLKAVGSKLWPEKEPDMAGRQLADCLNDAKREKLSPEQVLLILRLAREKGCHAGMRYIADALSYAEPQPIEPRDEADELRRQVLAMGSQLQRALERLDRIERPSTSMRAVA